MAPLIAIEDIRSVDPLDYIRAVGLRPEDSYGFIPMDLDDPSSLMWLYRDRPEYEERRFPLPGPASVGGFGGLPDPFGSSGGAPMSSDMPEGMLGDHLQKVIEDAQKMQEAWGGVPEMPKPEEGPSAPAAPGAPQIVAHRIYPGVRSRSSLSQLNEFLPRYRDTLQLVPEDVYGVYPASTRTSNSGDSFDTEWDDFWIVYRDEGRYAAGRQAWAAQMDDKGRWPEPYIADGVAEPGSAAYAPEKITVEKERWPREKMVLRKKGPILADAMREKIGAWGYEPEDSFGFCPDFGNGKIYFAWRTR